MKTYKVLPLLLILSSIVYGNKPDEQPSTSDVLLRSYVLETYRRILGEEDFYSRTDLVEDLLQRASHLRQSILQKANRSDADISTYFNIDTFIDFNRIWDRRNSIKCIASVQKHKSILYRDYASEVIPPFETSIYNLYSKMCSLNAPTIQ